jgi:predicted Zn-dependent protease
MGPEIVGRVGNRVGTGIGGSALASAFLLLLSQLSALGGSPCGELRSGEPFAITPLLRPAAQPIADRAADYRHRLQTTPMGWPLQTTWCVWVEPPELTTPLPQTTQRWQVAIAKALQEWQQILPIALVGKPEQAQVLVWRRRPPLGQDGGGRARASHGRALLSLRSRGEGRAPTVEPRVEVLISPGQRLEAIQATALHELGHAFGIWGHSDQAEDAMAVSPGPHPILQLSERDRATVRWLYQQPTPMRSNP